jgi:hypothetical protein
MNMNMIQMLMDDIYNNLLLQVFSNIPQICSSGIITAQKHIFVLLRNNFKTCRQSTFERMTEYLKDTHS